MAEQYSFMPKKINSFTLIELLVVIAIIGILATIVVVNISNVRAKARDMKRVEELNQIRTALEMYYSQYGKYPNNTDTDAGPGCGDPPWAPYWDAGTVAAAPGDTFIKPLVDTGFFTKVPIETNPISGYPCGRKYDKKPDRIGNCQYIYAVLWTKLETHTNPSGKGDERPACIQQWVGPFGSIIPEGATSSDYAIWLPF